MLCFTSKPSSYKIRSDAPDPVSGPIYLNPSLRPDIIRAESDGEGCSFEITLSRGSSSIFGTGDRVLHCTVKESADEVARAFGITPPEPVVTATQLSFDDWLPEAPPAEAYDKEGC